MTQLIRYDESWFAPEEVAVARPNRSGFRAGNILGFFGALGSGKTLCASVFACYLRATLGMGISANYDFIYAERLESIPQLFAQRERILVIDEVHASVLDARSFKERKSVSVTHWIDLIRKDGCALVYTAQSMRRADVRLRDITTHVGFCEYHPERDAIKLQFFKMSPGGVTAFHLGYVTITASKFFGIYNTKDKRVVLADEYGGLAREPLGDITAGNDSVALSRSRR